MSKKELIKRYALFIFSLFCSALGISSTKHAGLGVSPISAIANVLSIEYESITIGTWLIIFNVILIILQIVILRKNFDPVQLMQLPLSFLFGFFTDLCMSMVTKITLPSYIAQLAMVFIGILILSMGITLAVIAAVVMNSGEAFVKAIAETIKKKFGDVKVAFDICCVIIALTLSLIFFDFNIVGIREGTILTAVLTGFVVKFYTKYLKAPVEKLLV